MPEYFEQENERGLRQRYSGGWRVVAAAWALAVLVVLLFGGVQALASRHVTPPAQERLVGAVIPRHDASCDLYATDAASATNCQVTGDFLERAAAESAAATEF